MGGTPNPINPDNVGRIVIAGSVVGIIIIGLFLGSWYILGSLNVDIFFRLIISVCLPPALLFIMFGGYLLLRRSQAPDIKE